jgi:hypothetical protein
MWKTNVLVLQMLEQLQLAVCPLGEHRGAKGLHNLFDGDIGAGKLVLRGAVCGLPLVSAHFMQHTQDKPVRTRPSRMRPCQPVGGRNTSR